MRFSDLKNARVAILGAGREGQAVWRQLRRRFPSKQLFLFAETAIDTGFLQQLDAGLDPCHIGPLEYARLGQFDVLVRSAGISPYRKVLSRLRSSGKPFTTASNLWFAENPTARTICISGTKGKSTTAALTTHLLNHAGVKASLAGNIGEPMLDRDDDRPDWWVIELSSYQIADLEAEPDIALLLNLSDEHVDWHTSAERYRADKLKLAGLAGHVIGNFTDVALLERLADLPAITWFNHPQTWQAADSSVTAGDGRFAAAPAALPGEHNMQNLAAALTVLDHLGLEVRDIDHALQSFAGLPHRLQLVGEKEGIRYVNDSISTTPVSVAAALKTFGYRDVVLLLGGMDRGLDWRDFAADLATRTPHAIITLPDNGPNITACLEKAGVKPAGGIHAEVKLADAVALAQRLVPAKGCILLSPGAPSFPHFRDFEDRGEQFVRYAGIEKCIQGAH